VIKPERFKPKNEFQSLIGKLRTINAVNCRAMDDKFQSLIGKLRTSACQEKIPRDVRSFNPS